MARTAITPQTITVGGVVVTAEAANVDGNSVRLGGGTKVLKVINGSGGAITVTLQTPGTVSGLGIADRTDSVAAGTTEYLLLDEVLRRADDDMVYIDYSAVTTVTVAVLDIP